MTEMKTAILSDDDREKVDKLRKLVQYDLTRYYDTDFNLLRWIQGFSENIEETGVKLRAHLKARASTWKLDEMSKAPREHPIHRHWRYGITGLSGVLENVVVNIEQCGRTDYWGMLQTHSIIEILRARIPDLENMLYHVMEVEKKTGKQASILFVMDLTELKYDTRLYQLVVGPLKCLAEFMSEHYVELIKFFVLVNAPSFVYALWTIVKPLLPEKTKNKVRILSSSNWKNEILEYACAESLPDIWNSPDEPKLFTAKVSPPIKYPENNYWNAKSIKDPKNLQKLRIAAGKKLFLTGKMRKNDVLDFWICANIDMGFGIFRTDEELEEDISKMETIYPLFGWIPGPTLVPLEDSITIPKSGFYKIIISNEKAWWNTLLIDCKFSEAFQ